jgi:hypothetical protein
MAAAGRFRRPLRNRPAGPAGAARYAGILDFSNGNGEAIMWTRRLLLATMVAAAAMSLPRQLPASGGGTYAMTISANALR